MRSRIALKMLLHDRATTAGSLIGVIAIVFLVGQQLAVLFGLFTYMSVLVDHSDADIWVCTANTASINNAGLLPTRYLERISALPEVAWAEPLLFGGGTFKTKDGRHEGVQVVGVRTPRRALGPWKFQSGSLDMLLEREAVTVDAGDLDILGNPQLRQVCEINDTRVIIGGITSEAKGFSGRLAFTNIGKAREILKTPPGRCKALLVKIRSADRIPAAVERIRKMLPGVAVLTAGELSNQTRAYYITNTGMGGSFGFSTMVGALVGIIIITLTMYTGVLQRQKDFAVLRALGARKTDIFVVVLCQSLMIAVGGIFIGFLLLAGFLAGTQNSPLPSHMPAVAGPILAFSTLLLCVAGSVLAMRKAVSIEPASVFR